MPKFVRGCLGLLCVLGLAACAGKSDSLGLVEGEQTKTYAEAFAPARDALRAGRFDELVAKMNTNPSNADGERLSDEETKEKLIARNSELAIVERGLLTLNSGDFERALLFFDAAEQKMEQTEAENPFSSFGSAVSKGAVSALFGAEEVRDYVMRGYEKVMLLNYKALCYMLLGDRRAYNVTRKAIDKQQEEWEKFKEMLAALEEEQAKGGQMADVAGKVDADDRDAATKKKAAMVPNAYVNPFGDYMDAMLMEMDSLADSSLRDNVRIAYQKVVENNKDCSVARTAASQARKGVPRGKKLVHVILADGFAPERKEMTKGYQVDQLKAVVNYAEAIPVPTMVGGARVSFAGSSARLASLSRMESIILRDDQDRLPLRTGMIALALLRSGAASAFLGDFGVKVAASMQRPDTRSWLSLPNQVIVARLYVPTGTTQIKLDTLSAKGGVLASTTVPIAKQGPTVVYAVSYDKQLRAYANKHSWIK